MTVDADREHALRRDSAGLRTILNIFAKWAVSGDRAARLLGVSVETMDQWRTQVADRGALREPVSADTLYRMSYILGIWKAAAILLPNEAAAIRLVSAPNTEVTFGGRSPLERMLDGRIEDLAAVRAQFDAWCN